MANDIGRTILDDEPASEDLLDYNSYAKVLKDIVLHENTSTPITIGIFGKWGIGKSTLMKLLEAKFEKEQVITIWFNAWQYNEEKHLWAAYLQSLLIKIDSNLAFKKYIFYKIRLLFNRIDRVSLNAWLFKVVGLSILSTIPIVISFLVRKKYVLGDEDAINAIGITSSIMAFILLVVKPVYKGLLSKIKIDFSKFYKKENFKDHISFLDNFKEHFRDLVKSLPAKRRQKLIIFIDDLDRCTSDKIIQVLDSIKLFTDVKGCVYILGLDSDIVQKALEKKYEGDELAQKEYLAKIIQIPFQIPPLTRDDMETLVKKMNLNLPDPRCKDVLVRGLKINPREIKRTINIFSLLWRLASERKELKNQIHAVRLSKIVVIQQAYKELYQLLESDLSLLSKLERQIRVEQSSGDESVDNDLPSEVQRYIEEQSIKEMMMLFKHGESASPDCCFENLSAGELLTYFTLTNQVEDPNVESAKSVFEDNSGFLTEFGIEATMQRHRFFESNERIIDKLLIFKISSQRTWLVTTSRSLFCLLDDEKTRKKGSVVQWHLPLEKANPINSERKSRNPNSGLVDIGPRKNWLYSLALFEGRNDLKDQLEEMIKEAKKENDTAL